MLKVFPVCQRGWQYADCIHCRRVKTSPTQNKKVSWIWRKSFSSGDLGQCGVFKRKEKHFYILKKIIKYSHKYKGQILSSKIYAVSWYINIVVKICPILFSNCTKNISSLKEMPLSWHFKNWDTISQYWRECFSKFTKETIWLQYSGLEEFSYVNRADTPTCITFSG